MILRATAEFWSSAAVGDAALFDDADLHRHVVGHRLDRGAAENAHLAFAQPPARKPAAPATADSNTTAIDQRRHHIALMTGSLR